MYRGPSTTKTPLATARSPLVAKASKTTRRVEIVRPTLFTPLLKAKKNDHTTIPALFSKHFKGIELTDVEDVIDYVFPRKNLNCRRLPSWEGSRSENTNWWETVCDCLYADCVTKSDDPFVMICRPNPNDWHVVRLTMGTSAETVRIACYSVNTETEEFKLFINRLRSACMLVHAEHNHAYNNIRIEDAIDEGTRHIMLREKMIAAPDMVQCPRPDLEPNTHGLRLLWWLSNVLGGNDDVNFESYIHKTTDNFMPSTSSVLKELYVYFRNRATKTS